MFLDRLNAAQKDSFLALATRLVMADGEISDGEQALLDALKAEMGGIANAPAEQIFGNTDLDVFDTEEVRLLVLIELAQLASSDEKLHVDESHVILDVAQTFGFGRGATEALIAAASGWGQGIDFSAAVAEARAAVQEKG